MTYTQALRDAMRVSRAMRCRVAILYGGVDHGHDWKGERKEGEFNIPPTWRMVSVVNRGQLEGRD